MIDTQLELNLDPLCSSCLVSHISTQRKEGGYSIPKFGTEGRKLKMGMELEMVGREPLSRMEWEMEKRKN